MRKSCTIGSCLVWSLFVLSTTGCAKQKSAADLVRGRVEPPLVGNWKLQSTASQPIMPSSTSQLKLDAEGGFTIVMSNGGKLVTIRGAARQEGSMLTLEKSFIDGKPPTTEDEKRPATLKVSADGKSLTTEDGYTFVKD